jgi:hypothetical protein
MTRTLKQFGYVLIFLTAMGAPAAAQNASKEEPNKETALLKQLGELKKSIETLDQKVTDLQADVRLYSQNTQKEVNNLYNKIDDLKKQLDRMEAALKALEKSSATPHTANFPPAEGRVILRNNYPQPVDVIVNGTMYNVRPNSDYEVKLAAGTFTFRIPAIAGYQIDQNRAVSAASPYVITIQ